MVLKNSFHDFSGDYTHSNEQDYPSVSQINHKVKENSVNLIFAVTEEQFGVYDLLQQNVEGSSVGTLSNDSSNIVELVKAQYQAITSSIGKNQSPHLFWITPSTTWLGALSKRDKFMMNTCYMFFNMIL